MFDKMILNFLDVDEGGVDIGFLEGIFFFYILKIFNYNINERFNGEVLIIVIVLNEFFIGDIIFEIIGFIVKNIERINNSWLEVFLEYDLKMKWLYKKYSVVFEKYIESLKNEIGYSNICEEMDDSIEVLVDREFVDDNFLNNMSSIFFLVISDGKKILFFGDSDIKIILEWMDCKGYEIFEVDVVKLLYYGSKYNYNKSLLERVFCKKYLISINGKKYLYLDIEILV